MTRKKVTLAYVTNDSERKASFKKRKKGLIKKVSELSTLCGVQACAIIYSQYDAEPEVWPSLLGAQAVLARFRKLSEMDQCRKMVNQESFTRQRIKKAEEQLRRLQKENKRSEMEMFLFQYFAGIVTLDDFDMRNVAEMNWVVNQMLRDIDARIETLTAAAPPHPLATEMVPPPLMEERAVAVANEDNIEGFPWNLVDSPTGGSGVGRGLGWDDGMVLPYPYIFNHSNFTNFELGSGSGSKPQEN